MVSDLAPLDWHVTRCGLGDVFSRGSPVDLAGEVKRLAVDASRWRRCAEAVRRIHETEACWETQAERLRDAVLG